jgi:hypothetical protein
MEDHYREAIRMPAEVVGRVSDYMVNVRSVVSYGVSIGFPPRRLLGVLSIDLAEPPQDVFSSGLFEEDLFHQLVQSLADLESVAQRWM